MESPFFLGTWLDPEVPVVVLVLLKWVELNPPTKPALKPEFNWAVVLVLPEWVAPNPPTELALKPQFNWVVGCKPAEMPKFCCLPPTLRGAECDVRIHPASVEANGSDGHTTGKRGDCTCVDGTSSGDGSNGRSSRRQRRGKS